jgi:hypothetical protein
MLFPCTAADGSNWLVSPNLQLVCRVGGGHAESFDRGHHGVPEGLWPAFLSDRGQLFFTSPRGLAVSAQPGSLEEIAWPGSFTVNKIQFRDDGSELLVESLDASGGSSLWKLAGGRFTPLLTLPKGEPFMWQASPSLNWLAGYRRGTQELVVWCARETMVRVPLPTPLLQFWIGEGDRMLLQNVYGHWEMRDFSGQAPRPVLLSPEAAVRGGPCAAVLFYLPDPDGGGGYYRLDLSQAPTLRNCAVSSQEGLVIIHPPDKFRSYQGSRVVEGTLQDDPPLSLAQLCQLGQAGKVRISPYFQPMLQLSDPWTPLGAHRLSPAGVARLVGKSIPVGASAGRVHIDGRSYTVKVEPLPRFGYLFQPQPEADHVLDNPPFTLQDLLRLALQHGGTQVRLEANRFPETRLENGWVALGDQLLSERAVNELLQGFAGQVEGVSFEIQHQGPRFVLLRSS